MAEVVEVGHEYVGNGTINEFAVEVWPDTIRPSDEAAETSALISYEEFRRWSDAEDVSLEPEFTCLDRSSLGSDDDTVVVLPMVSLAIRVDGRLYSVAPHSTETATYTVEDALLDIGSNVRVPSGGDITAFPAGHTAESAGTAGPSTRRSIDEPNQ